MYVTEVRNNQRHLVEVKSLDDDDFKYLTKSRYYFNWKTEKGNELYKLVLNDEILGLISWKQYHGEQRIEIRLLAVAKENRGKNKKYHRIAEVLMAFACRAVVQQYGFEGLVSLVPKTRLKGHYMEHYGMLDAGRQLFFAGQSLLNILKEFEL